MQGQTSMSALQVILANQQILNMLNTKYIIGNPAQPPILNNSAFGHAWFVPQVRLVENADEEIMTLGQVDLRTTAVVDRRYEDLLSREVLDLDSAGGVINLTDYAPGSLRYESSSEQKQLAIFSEIFYERTETTGHFL